MVVPGMLIVSRDAAATADNILANENLYRLGIAFALVAVVFGLAGGLLLTDLLRVVDRRIARFAVFMLLLSGGLEAIRGLLLFGPLIVLRNTDALRAFTGEQRQALAVMFLRLNAIADNIFLAFFGVWLIAIGYLVFRSTFLPRFIGVGLMLEGLGWTAFFSPPLGAAIFPIIVAFGLVGELALGLWLVIRGVNSDRWRAQAARAQT